MDKKDWRISIILAGVLILLSESANWNITKIVLIIAAICALIMAITEIWE